ncbi:MAG: dihydrodiol dehydrogenase [Pseudonocardia sp.]|uniref:dihydrodiol dehydrogenase n=1 Tax=unclassified Pseudonocardia TaxID=2619320 RepID=UPI000AB890AF|nr:MULTISPECIES: dihydrodiol dehydrogenase [unclassified Pseudonocardia]MBN9113555.1 dihydrodiol dehydrogenase [Pseudonocardia sp.]
MTAPDRSPSGSRARTGEIALANEFGMVVVSKIRTHNGERLRIHAPQLDRAIDLCPLELESLTWQRPETFSRFLETPYGTTSEETTWEH